MALMDVSVFFWTFRVNWISISARLVSFFGFVIELARSWEVSVVVVSFRFLFIASKLGFGAMRAYLTSWIGFLYREHE